MCKFIRNANEIDGISEEASPVKVRITIKSKIKPNDKNSLFSKRKKRGRRDFR